MSPLVLASARFVVAVVCELAGVLLLLAVTAVLAGCLMWPGWSW